MPRWRRRCHWVRRCGKPLPPSARNVRYRKMDMSVIEDRKVRARTWFERVRDDICRAFEQLEDDAPASLYPGRAGRFVRTPWDRTDHTGQPGGGGAVRVDGG